MAGPSCDSVFDTSIRKAMAPYARIVVSLAKAAAVRNVLMIGGAGNAIALELQERGVDVTTIEIDGEAVTIAEQYCGELKGLVLVDDARAVLNWGTLDAFDMIVVDAFTGPGIAAPMLLTVECVAKMKALLSSNGRLVVNTHGAIAGEDSDAYQMIGDTLSLVFPMVRSVPVAEQGMQSTLYQNILFVCGADDSISIGNAIQGSGGVVATDDVNPLEVLMMGPQRRAWRRWPVGGAADLLLK
jgi:spermidine synthase